MSAEQVECVVIGAGIVGLAIASELAQRGHDVIIVEASEGIGQGVSARNSGVIHAGLYYPPNSLKARLCLRGRDLLYDFCAEHHVDHRRIGKLVVATDVQQEVALRALQKNAEANGVCGLRWLDTVALKQAEPELRGIAALESPDTGIVDVHACLLALLANAEAHGALLVRSAPVVGGERVGDQLRLRVGADGDAIQAQTVINAAGLSAWRVAAALGTSTRNVPARYLAKGNYFSYAGRVPFQRLIYPLPNLAGLGVHLTFDLQQRARFGPDVEWTDQENYVVDEARHAQFVAAIRHFWPAVEPQRLMPDFAGMRPKLVGAGAAAADFMLQEPADHGVPGLINLFGIESPGLTASLALAEHVTTQLVR